EPLTVYEPVTPLDEATPREADMVVRYAEALGHYRARRFEQAADFWLSLGADDGPAGVMARGPAPTKPRHHPRNGTGSLS
ncbi:MAG: hypothetical protein VCF08_03325, partial [Alphaproteobacteria bacterium]